MVVSQIGGEGGGEWLFWTRRIYSSSIVFKGKDTGIKRLYIPWTQRMEKGVSKEYGDTKSCIYSLSMELERNMVVKSPVCTPLFMEFERNMRVEHLYMPFYDFA